MPVISFNPKLVILLWLPIALHLTKVSSGPVKRTEVSPRDDDSITSMSLFNYNNVTCSELDSASSSTDVWNMANGDQVLSTFIDFWHNNKLICKDCYGLPKANCTSKNSDCAKGLGDMAISTFTVPPQNSQTTASRFDTALALFTGLENGAYSPDGCDITGAVLCQDSPGCGDFIGPGAWVLWASMSNIAELYNNQYSRSNSNFPVCTFPKKPTTNQAPTSRSDTVG